eukprot:194730-Chlamydomonas_euryale.AAC.1
MRLPDAPDAWSFLARFGRVEEAFGCVEAVFAEGCRKLPATCAYGFLRVNITRKNKCGICNTVGASFGRVEEVVFFL